MVPLSEAQPGVSAFDMLTSRGVSTTRFIVPLYWIQDGPANFFSQEVISLLCSANHFGVQVEPWFSELLAWIEDESG